jgi:ATP-dependent protease Clp ATPase subunit
VPTRSEVDVDIELEKMGEFLREYSTLLSPVNPKTDHLNPDQLLLLPECTFGYVFRSRRWLFLCVDDIKDITRTDEERKRGFKDLVIPLNYRQMLLALVENHARGSAKVQGMESSALGHMDLVAGKGNGLIILLHGPPGAGKTSTAETIATYTKRPLYSITCGDIGTVPEKIERSLENHFRLANKWGCVLLLDEADVFMAKRDWHSMERNAAVSGM